MVAVPQTPLFLGAWPIVPSHCFKQSSIRAKGGSFLLATLFVLSLFFLLPSSIHTPGRPALRSSLPQSTKLPPSPNTIQLLIINSMDSFEDFGFMSFGEGFMPTTSPKSHEDGSMALLVDADARMNPGGYCVIA